MGCRIIHIHQSLMTIHVTLVVMITCDSLQGSTLFCSFSNAVVSLRLRVFIYLTHLLHLRLIENYAYAFHHRNEHNTLAQLTLIILSYCDDNTRYTAACSLAQLVLHVETSLDKAGDFSLVAELGRKHKKNTMLPWSTQTSLTHYPHSYASPGATPRSI